MKILAQERLISERYQDAAVIHHRTGKTISANLMSQFKPVP
ncbi:hypothetical protein [Thermomonas brevis]|nr:hypothetical protein [Thermomonas brevis]